MGHCKEHLACSNQRTRGHVYGTTTTPLHSMVIDINQTLILIQKTQKKQPIKNIQQQSLMQEDNLLINVFFLI